MAGAWAHHPAAARFRVVAALPAVGGGRCGHLESHRTRHGGQRREPPDRLLRQPWHPVRRCHCPAAVRREPHAAGTLPATTGLAARPAGHLRHGGRRTGHARSGASVQLARPGADAGQPAEQCTDPGHDASGSQPDPDGARRPRRASQGALRLHQHLGQLPGPTAALAAGGLVVAWNQAATLDRRGRGGDLGGADHLLAEQRRLAGPGRGRRLSGGAAGGPGPGGAVGCDLRRDGPDHPGYPGHTTAAGHRPPLRASEEQFAPVVTYGGGGRGRLGLPDHWVRRHPAADRGPAVDRHRPHGQLPELRSGRGGQ